jgi:hypothetical protein
MNVNMHSVAGQEYLADKSRQSADLAQTTAAGTDQARSDNQSPERPETDRVTRTENRLLDTYA